MGKPLAAIVLGVLLIGAWFAQPISSTSALTPRRAAVQYTPPGMVTEGVVPQAAPTWIAIEPGVLARTMLDPAGIRAVNGVVVPADNRPVFRTDSNEPGTDSPGTSFIVGHNYVDQSGEFIPFSALEKVAVGQSIVLGTPNGTLVYAVRQVIRVPKTQLDARTDLVENVPGRLILATCDTTVDGRDTTDNLVIIAALAT